MGALIRKAWVYLAERTGQIDLTNPLTQDTAKWVWDVMKELIKP